MPDTVYSADDIIGKSLYAKTQVGLKWLAADVARPFVWIDPGEMVGIVSSYVLPNAARANLYWQFYNQDGIPFYAEHVEGRFDLDALQEQGVKSTEQKLTEAAAATMSLSDKILAAVSDLGKYGITALAVVAILAVVIFLLYKKV